MNSSIEQESIPQYWAGKPVRVLCVDDNEHVAQAIRVKFEREEGIVWQGWLACPDELEAIIAAQGPAVIVLDLDMPGLDPFEALEAISLKYPNCRVVIFSGHVRLELIERGISAGAWGYVSKNDGEDSLVQAVREVCRDELSLSAEVRAAYGR